MNQPMMMAARATLDYFLYDWLRVERLTQRERFAERSRETFDAVLDLCEQLAVEKFAPFNCVIDAAEPKFRNDRVALPDATREACPSYAASGMLGAVHDSNTGEYSFPVRWTWPPTASSSLRASASGAIRS
jgi:hypothetical protein